MDACYALLVSNPNINRIRFLSCMSANEPMSQSINYGGSVPNASLHQDISLGTSDFKGSNSLVPPLEENKLPFCD